MFTRENHWSIQEIFKITFLIRVEIQEGKQIVGRTTI